MDKPALTYKSHSGERLLTVAVVTETYPPEVNGVARSIARMVEGLVARGHRVRLLRPMQSRKDTAAGEAGFSETLMASLPIPGYAGLRMGLPSALRLFANWKRERPDLVHVVTEGPLGLAAVLVARRLGIPLSSDFHTNFDYYSRHYGMAWFKGAVAGYLRWFHNLAAETYVPTREMQAALANRGFRGVEVVSRGVDCSLFAPSRRNETLRAQWGVKPDEVVACCVGRVAPEKNLELLLRTYRALRESVPNAHLVIVGDGPSRSRLQSAYPEVIFAGMQQGLALAEHYASADMFLFPSLSETFGNVTLEAMASGLPVVAYDYAAATEAIVDGESGVRVEPGDAESFVAAAVHLAGRPDLRAQIGLAARDCAERFDWEEVNDVFEQRLSEVARSSRGGELRPGRVSKGSITMRERAR